MAKPETSGPEGMILLQEMVWWGGVPYILKQCDRGQGKRFGETSKFPTAGTIVELQSEYQKDKPGGMRRWGCGREELGGQ